MTCQRCQHAHVDRIQMAHGDVWLMCRRCGRGQTASGAPAAFVPYVTRPSGHGHYVEHVTRGGGRMVVSHHVRQAEAAAEAARLNRGVGS